MVTSLTWYPDVSTFLPKGEPLARLLARLFVLWQDLLYEQAGIVDDDGFQAMDQFDRERLGRRLYFLRGNSRTLCSAKYLFDALVANPTFKAWLGEDPSLAADFFKAKAAFDKHRQAIERVRNTVGAHAEDDLGDAIEEFQPGDRARFEIHSRDYMRPHFAREILLAAFTRGAPRDREGWIAAYKASAGPLAEATNAMISAMAAVVSEYMRRFRLFPQ